MRAARPAGAPATVARAPRSGLLTFLALVFIALGGFATLVALLQVAVFNLFVPADLLVELAGAPEKVDEVPAAMRFLVLNLRAFAFFGFVFSVLTLVSAVGVLRRRDWGRLVLMALLSAGALLNTATAAFLVWLAFQPRLPAWLVPPEAAVSVPDAGAGLGQLALSSLVFAALLAGLVAYLHSRAVREEFDAF